MYFRRYKLRKPWSDKCLKSPISEDPSKSNMVNRPEHSTFSIFIHQCEGNGVQKSLPLIICKIF